MSRTINSEDRRRQVEAFLGGQEPEDHYVKEGLRELARLRSTMSVASYDCLLVGMKLFESANTGEASRMDTALKEFVVK